jgi:hypothetical protein
LLLLCHARVFNAIVEAGYSPKDLGGVFDTISVCLSKGLGCPVGSLLLGSKELIRAAVRVRKVGRQQHQLHGLEDQVSAPNSQYATSLQECDWHPACYRWFGACDALSP